ncbi:MAG: Zn-dependent hydrolase [Terriglobales bacterium]
MRNKAVLLLFLLSLAVTVNAQNRAKVSPRNGKGPIGFGRAGNGPISAHWKVSSEVDAGLAKYKTVRMSFNAAALTVRERQMVHKLVEASQYLESAFWRQSDPEALKLYQQLRNSKYPRDEKVRRFLFINASRFDLLDDNSPFIGSGSMPPGRDFYPPGIARQQIEEYVKARPERKAEIYSGRTVVRRQGDELAGLPYHVVYRAFLDPAAKALREAAALSSDKQFAEFLRLRADALLTDDYYESDLAWVDLQNPKFDVVFAPYEVYLDDLLGVKTSYGAAVLIRNETESKKLQLFERYVADIQDALPLSAEDRPSKKGQRTPMEVVDSPFRAGDLNHGYQPVAANLPNDPRIQQEKGSKRIFFKNFMDARVTYVVQPMAKRMMKPDQAALVSGEGYLVTTIMHEISHGLGPNFARVNGKQVDIREALGPIYSSVEEAKADAVGMYGLIWLIDHGYVPQSKRKEYFASYVADFFRALRFGVSEAHGQAEMMELNYLAEQKAVTRDASGRYAVDYGKMPAAVTVLAKELLEIEATADRARAEAWFSKYDKMPPEMAAQLNRQKDIPVDISPVFSFPEKVR